MIGQRIAYPDDPIHAAMWLSALRVAAEMPAIVAQFEKETGEKWIFSQKRSAIEALIDSTTGRTEGLVAKFVDWFNTNVWGEDPFTNVQDEEAEVPPLPGKEV